MEKRSTSAFVTGNFLLEGRILHAELNAEFCLCIFKELSHAGQVYVCTCLRVRCVRAQYQRRYLRVRREDWTGQHAKFREVIFARGIPHPYRCILRRLKAGSIEKAAYCFMRALQRDSPFLRPPRRRWSPTRNCGKKVEVKFSNLTILAKNVASLLESNALF